MNLQILHESIQPIIDLAVTEDIGTGDVSSIPIFTSAHRSSAEIISKADGVFCGGMIPGWVYASIDKSVSVTTHTGEGVSVHQGDKLLSISGPTSSILAGERISLNFLQRCCGIATRTRHIVNMIQNPRIKILDTRKTLPGYRNLDKYCVSAGGGCNHRFGLHDMVMIKDNHIAAAGSITSAVNSIRSKYGATYKIEVETTTLSEVEEALTVKPDIIMLDNMDLQTMKKAVTLISGKSKIEISGNITEQSIEEISTLDIDYISIGALTHSVTAFDISMKIRGE